MSNLGDPNPRPSGFFANIRAAYTPRPLSEEEAAAPLERPRSVLVAGFMAMFAGLVFIIGAVAMATSIDAAIDDAWEMNAADIATCTEGVGGIGAFVVAEPAEEDKALADACRDYEPLTQDRIDTFRSMSKVISVVFGALGLALLWFGWNLKKGAYWARRGAMGITAVLAIAVMIGVAPNLLFLGATFITVIAVMTCYVGLAGRYFARVRYSQSQ